MESPRSPSTVTDVEIKTLRLISQGETVASAAKLLERTEPAIRKRLLILRAKLGAKHLAHAVGIAKDGGVI